MKQRETAVRVLKFTGILMVTLTLALKVQPVTAQDWWPMFRHDLSHTGSTTSMGPDTNNVLWTFPTGDMVYSSPAVVDSKVYVGS
ncbi:MAG: PQQ-binding-like beta-propeller repeat protein, partial [Deltaproteobacteria bacterium]|nr:PQQ-binding-like beta-propeller repeat protein [Deltaproteobacteria bacterium]